MTAAQAKKNLPELKYISPGHYKVTFVYRGKEISATITDMQKIDDYNSDEDERKGRKIRWLQGYNDLRNEVIRKNKNQ